jgi:DNA-binding NtrC family response regulator
MGFRRAVAGNSHGLSDTNKSDTLKKASNNKAEDAQRLNVDYKTLCNKLKKINIYEVK